MSINDQEQEHNAPLEPVQEAHQEPLEPSLEEQLQAMKDQWLRAVADKENTLKRAQKEREDALKYSITSFAKDIITIGDYIEQAITLMNKNETIDQQAFQSFLEGVKMTAQALHQTFERHGIKKIPTQEQKFDPNFHQAVHEVPTNDHEPGTIITVMQEGYTLHDRLLRPSMVGIAKADTAVSQ